MLGKLQSLPTILYSNYFYSISTTLVCILAAITWAMIMFQAKGDSQ